MKHLISMTDFVLEQIEINSFDEDKMSKIWKYAKFLKQPLELWMFVPCKLVDGAWRALERLNGGMREQDERRHKEYQQAKERCLFDWVEIDGAKHHIKMGRNVEYLANFGMIKLTITALKQLE